MMKKLLSIILALGIGLPIQSLASPQEDLKAFRTHFQKGFPGIPLQEYGNGVYAIDEASRSQWEAIE